jgi:hypothetical protein
MANENIAIGYQAGFSNTTGSQNTATGYHALRKTKEQLFREWVDQVYPRISREFDAVYDAGFNDGL